MTSSDLIPFVADEQLNYGINVIYDYFGMYVPRSKKFNPRAVVLLPSIEKKRYSYDYDGVTISFFGRHTWHLDDYDYCVDVKIIVDGIVILNLEKF